MSAGRISSAELGEIAGNSFDAIHEIVFADHHVEDNQIDEAVDAFMRAKTHIEDTLEMLRQIKIKRAKR